MKKWREGPERDIDISRRSMDRKTKEEKESCKCATPSLKKNKMRPVTKRTIITESEINMT